MLRTASVFVLCLTLLVPAKSLFASDIEDVRAQVFAWGQAWQSRDIDRYMSFYSPDFRSKKFDYRSWREKKTRAFKRAKRIRVEISDLWVFIEQQVAIASFVQRYYDQHVMDVGEKTLILARENSGWKIVSEAWKPLKIPGQATQKKSADQHGSQRDQAMRTKNLPIRTAVPAIRKKTAKRNDDDSQRSTRPAPQAGHEPKAKDLKQVKNIVKTIRFEIQDDSEKVFMELNRFLIPKILTLEGDKPRIVIDIMNVFSWDGPSKIPVNGKIIRRIRTYLHRDINKLRIVLDLNPADDYLIDQTFDKAKNTYCIDVR